MKYPLSHSLGKTLSEKFEEILRFHIPPNPDKVILDPTCGAKRYLWESLFNGLEKVKQLDLDGNRITLPWKVFFSDIEDFGYNKVCDVKDLVVEVPVDGIIYDPPYFFGADAIEGVGFERSKDYGKYDQNYEKLLWFMDIANQKFPSFLKDEGKLIVKCSDQYDVKTRKFYPLHIVWAERLTNFDVIDFFVCPHHHVSPTAFQIKDRPCSIIMHTYFMVFSKKIGKV